MAGEGRLHWILALWFGFTAPVDRRSYALTGFSLMAFKYLVDAGLVRLATGAFWSPADYLSPLLKTRTDLVDDPSQWVLWVLLAWSLPFVWIGASMTVRRALDAGLPAWTGLLFFAPVVNYLCMLGLCVLPSRPRGGEAPTDLAAPGARLLAAAGAAAVGLVAALLSVFAFGSYGAALFAGAPFAMGFAAGYPLGRSGAPRAEAFVAAQLAVLLAAGALLLFALEGVLCLAMAWPLAAALAAVGTALGLAVAGNQRLEPRHAALLLACLPLLMGVEAAGPAAPVREVVTAIEIDAAPEAVWSRVVGFSELPPPSRLVFHLGIAYPTRARIEGAGVGALRTCEFSTGPFVEPITVWDAPRRLGFDVASQPEPMHETSPYRVVHAPHLLDGLRSERGEFRLQALPGGRTRLEGSTWYAIEMFPQAYWTLFSDALIHAIHERVLSHVKALAEADAARIQADS